MLFTRFGHSGAAHSASLLLSFDKIKLVRNDFSIKGGRSGPFLLNEGHERVLVDSGSRNI